MLKLLDAAGLELKWMKRCSWLCDDDFVDRLHHRITTTLLLILSIIVTSNQFVGSAIDCWVPAHFTVSQLEYVNNYCWIHNTYYLPYDKDVERGDDRDRIPYYQWVPFILLAQSLMFYCPYLLWQKINVSAGINVKNLIAAGNVFITTEMAELRQKTLSNMIRQMDRYLTKCSAHRNDLQFTLAVNKLLTCNSCQACHRRRSYFSGSSLSILYVTVKSVYFLNAIGQLFLLDFFLGYNFHAYGIEMIHSAVNNLDWSATTSRFPRTAMCDLKIRRLGDVHRYSVECVLPINLFNEKIFLFLWFWFVFLGVITGLSLVTWIMRLSSARKRFAYIRNHLQFGNENPQKKKAALFADRYLRSDGVFVMMLVDLNTDAITVTEFVCALWNNFIAKKARNGHTPVRDFESSSSSSYYETSSRCGCCGCCGS